MRYFNFAVCELSGVCGTSYGLAGDYFHAETNSCGICGARHVPVSFAEYSGTAVSRFSPSLRRESETQTREMTDNRLAARISNDWQIAPVGLSQLGSFRRASVMCANSGSSPFSILRSNGGSQRRRLSSPYQRRPRSLMSRRD